MKIRIFYIVYSFSKASDIRMDL